MSKAIKKSKKKKVKIYFSAGVAASYPVAALAAGTTAFARGPYPSGIKQGLPNVNSPSLLIPSTSRSCLPSK